MDEMRLIHDIAYKVREYVPGKLEWIAKQKSDEHADLYGFVIGRGFAVVTVTEAQNADDTLIRSLAAQILGYEVDSAQDLERRRDDAVKRIDDIEEQIQQLREQKKYWEQERFEAIAKLDQKKWKPGIDQRVKTKDGKTGFVREFKGGEYFVEFSLTRWDWLALDDIEPA